MSDSDELTDQLSELRVSSAQPLDIQSSEKQWKIVKLCNYNRLTKDGNEVAGFDQSTGEPTLWFKDEQQIGRKILNYRSCVPLLNKGFATKYAEYEEMCQRESPLGDENFQAFLFVKWLNSSNETLKSCLEMCFYEDMGNLYEAWLAEVCGFTNRKEVLTEVEDLLRKYKTKEDKIVKKRPYIQRKTIIIKKTLDEFIGGDLEQVFNSLPPFDEKFKTFINFIILDKFVFRLKLKSENGNGTMVFSPEVEKIYPSWDTLSKTVLMEGFSSKYKKFKKKKFAELGHGCELDKSFQAFVLLQFEKNRVGKNDQAELTRDEIEQGIKIALDMDQKKYYRHMTQMFMLDKRRKYYELLIMRAETNKEVSQKLENSM